MSIHMHMYAILIFIGYFLTVYCYDDNGSAYYGSGGGGVTIILIVGCCCGWRRRNRNQEVPPPAMVTTDDGQPVYPIATPIQPGSYSGSGKYRGQIISLQEQQPTASNVSTSNRLPPYSSAYYKPAPSNLPPPYTSENHKPESITAARHQPQHASNVSVGLNPSEPSASSVSTSNRPPPYSSAYYKPAPSSATGHQSKHASNISAENKPASIYSTGTFSSEVRD